MSTSPGVAPVVSSNNPPVVSQPAPVDAPPVVSSNIPAVVSPVADPPVVSMSIPAAVSPVADPPVVSSSIPAAVNPVADPPVVSSNIPAVVPQPAPAEPTPAVLILARALRNDVNLKKDTLRLEKDETNPGYHLVAFSFDAVVSGSISIFFVTREDERYGLTQLKPDLYKVTRIPFLEGLGQDFRQAPECGVNLSLFDENDLLQAGENGEYALVVRVETEPQSPPPNDSVEDETALGAPLPSSIPYSCHITKAVVQKEGANVRVRSQNIWVDGILYELQEIYGCGTGEVGSLPDGSESGKECVICLTEPGNEIIVLPCRHMCMCLWCAQVLRLKKSTCPICQAPMKRLLHVEPS